MLRNRRSTGLVLAGLVSVLAVVAEVASPPPASADPSYAFEDYNGSANAWSGLAATWVDHLTYIPLTEPCEAQVMTGHYALEFTELLLPSGPGTYDWRALSLGTVHRCRGYRFWWAHKEIDGDRQTLFTSGPVGIATHQFRIENSGLVWRYYVDATEVAVTVAPCCGKRGQAGLFSTSPISTVPVHSYFNLMQRQWGGSYQWWDDQDYSWVSGTTCGYWISDTSWLAGQNVSC